MNSKDRGAHAKIKKASNSLILSMCWFLHTKMAKGAAGKARRQIETDFEISGIDWNWDRFPASYLSHCFLAWTSVRKSAIKIGIGMQPCAFAYHLYYMLCRFNTNCGSCVSWWGKSQTVYILTPALFNYSTVSNYNLRFVFNWAFWRMICIFFAISSSMRRPVCNRMAWDHWPHDWP